MMKSLQKICPIAVGTILLVSALSKAIDSAAFADLLSSYGFEWFGYCAPVIILTELSLALLLIFRLTPRISAFLAVVFLFVATIVYSYGLLFRDITDCGCFGKLTILNHSPLLVYFRNSVLLLLLVPTIMEKVENKTLSTPIVLYMAVIMSIGCFMTGFSFRTAKLLNNRGKAFRPILLSQTPLNDYIQTGSDSTYLVFVFSYTCPYCLNSINNVNQYEQVGSVDKVIGLALEDSTAQAFFEQYFTLTFDVCNLPFSDIQRIAQTLPTTYYLHGDTVLNVATGLVPNPLLFNQ